MTRSKRLSSIVKLMNHRQQEAARHLGDCARRLEQQRRRLEELETYREEYLRSYQHYIQAGMSMSRVNDYHQFISQLEQAISQQRESICNADREYESCRQEWLNRHNSSKAMDKMVNRYRVKEQQLEDKREQKDNDENSRNAKGHDWMGKRVG